MATDWVGCFARDSGNFSARTSGRPKLGATPPARATPSGSDGSPGYGQNPFFTLPGDAGVGWQVALSIEQVRDGSAVAPALKTPDFGPFGPWLQFQLIPASYMDNRGGSLKCSNREFPGSP